MIRKTQFALFLMLIMSSLTLAQDEDLTPYEIALERILEAEQSGAGSLDLEFLGLYELPPEIGNLNNLRSLYLDYNNLSSLPSEIGNLRNLQTLTLAGNQLTSLPPEIGNLRNLQILTLGGNQLTSSLSNANCRI